MRPFITELESKLQPSWLYIAGQLAGTKNGIFIHRFKISILAGKPAGQTTTS
jgi:hypothetical protein